jgi:hypothetical protein
MEQRCKTGLIFLHSSDANAGKSYSTGGTKKILTGDNLCLSVRL